MGTPYDDIAEVIARWCERHYYADFLVTVSVRGRPLTEVLEYDASNDMFIWLGDWWEGEEDVRLLGFLPVDAIKIISPAPGTACRSERDCIEIEGVDMEEDNS